MLIEKSRIKKQRKIFFLILILIVFTIIVSMRLGDAELSYNALFKTFLGKGTMKDELVLFELRLPRIAITLLAGMALALSGSILQSITQNDLAEPGILGINAGAGVAVTIFFLFVPIDAEIFSYLIPIVAFIGALLTSIIIYVFSFRKHQGIEPIRLVLLGVGFSMALSGLMIVIISSAERSKVEFISRWLSGNIWVTDWAFVFSLLPWIVFLIPVTLYKANRLNIIKLSKPVAIGVGISIEKERIQLLLAAVALAASAVSVTGSISFIGLMAPHLSKGLVGHRNQMSIPIAILIGGFLLLFADTVGQHLIKSSGIPAGIVVAIIGAPYFIYLLLKK